MNSELRIAMMQAMEERQELGHELLGPDHLLLGMLSNVRGSAYAVFAEHGVTYDWARKVVEEKHDDDLDGEPEEAADESADNLDDDREALRAIGIDLDKVRDAVRDTFGEDITERWGDRPRRGERGRRRHGHGPHGPGHGPHGPGHGPHDHEHGPHEHSPHDGPPEEREGRHGPEFGPFAEFFAEFGSGPRGPRGPRGRGRRGPRSRRFPRISPSLRDAMQQIHDGLMRDLRDGMRHGDGPGALEGVTTARVLAAVLASGDPAVDAVIEAADDPKALRAAIDDLAGKATA